MSTGSRWIVVVNFPAKSHGLPVYTVNGEFQCLPFYTKPLLLRPPFSVDRRRGSGVVPSNSLRLCTENDTLKSRGFVYARVRFSKTRFPCRRNPYFSRMRFLCTGPGVPLGTVQIHRACARKIMSRKVVVLSRRGEGDPSQVLVFIGDPSRAPTGSFPGPLSMKKQSVFKGWPFWTVAFL